ncbi:MAG: PAS domain-containing sensor histidine kinase [Chitinophagaceae bacterium]
MSTSSNAFDSLEKMNELLKDDNVQQCLALFNYATVGIVITDKEGVIINFNKYVEIQFGYTKADVLGKKVEILLPQSIHAKHEAYRDKFIKHPQNRIMGAGRDLYARKKDGTEFPVEVSLSHYSLNNDEYVIAFVVDITIRKKNEDLFLQQQRDLKRITTEVQNMNRELEQKVLERTMMLKETLAELEKSKEVINQALAAEIELGELKSRFVTMASHEFRTPLSTIYTSLSLIEKYTTTEEQDKRERHVLRSKEAVNNMKNMLEDFLSLGKLEEGKMKVTISEFDIALFVETILSGVQNLKKAGQHFIYVHQGKPLVTTDGSLFKNIIINLISNAIKFSPENSVINVTSFIDANKMQLSVKDEGIGITEEDQQHLFERFFRGKNALNIEGTGLGLAIIAKYLTILEGTIQCKSSLDKGTEFIVTFQNKY